MGAQVLAIPEQSVGWKCQRSQREAFHQLQIQDRSVQRVTTAALLGAAKVSYGRGRTASQKGV